MSDTRRFAEIAFTVARLAVGWKLAAVGIAALLGLLAFVGLFVAATGSATGGQSCVLTGAGGKGVPPAYVPWLARAATKYRLGPRGFAIVAAVHEIESDFGRSTLPGVRSGTNFAGASGPGQFLAASWDAYGVDADGDGRRNVYSIPDSVFGTANYLRASGAPGDWHDALFAYNHAEWYVQDVLEASRRFGSGTLACRPATSPQLGALPAAKADRIAYVARWIESRRIPYCWGGGHAAAPGPSDGSYCWNAQGRQVFGSDAEGLDCSGAVRWLLVLAGYPDPGGLRSDALGAAYPPGPGARVTIWSNPGHVFVTIDGRDWGTASSHIAHGPAFGEQSSAGFAPNHPPGL